MTWDGIRFKPAVVIITAAGIEWTRARLAFTLGGTATPAVVQEIKADRRINPDVTREMPSAGMRRRIDTQRVTLDPQGTPAGLIYFPAEVRHGPPDGMSCTAGVTGCTPDLAGFTADLMEKRADLMEIPAEVMEMPTDPTEIPADVTEMSADRMEIPADGTCFTADGAEISYEVTALTADARPARRYGRASASQMARPVAASPT